MNVASAARRLLKRTVVRAGADFAPAQPVSPVAPALSWIQDVPHGPIQPNASYSPWLADPLFLRSHEAIAGHTLVDLYRCWELWCLAARLSVIAGDVLEVGVWRGGTGCLMAQRAQTVAPDRSVFLCDTFRGVVGASDKDPSYVGGEHADTTEEIVTALAARMQLDNVRVLKGTFPSDTAARIADRRFALVHIDVDVHDSARACFSWAWERTVVGGTIVFDDYGFSTCVGVTRMVNDLSLGADGVVIHNLNGHAVVVKSAHGRDID